MGLDSQVKSLSLSGEQKYDSGGDESGKKKNVGTRLHYEGVLECPKGDPDQSGCPGSTLRGPQQHLHAPKFGSRFEEEEAGNVGSQKARAEKEQQSDPRGLNAYEHDPGRRREFPKESVKGAKDWRYTPPRGTSPPPMW